MTPMLGRIAFDEPIIGLIVDHQPSTPWLTGQLTLSETFGISLEVPFAHDGSIEQFAEARRWFSEKSGPSRLTFVSSGTRVDLWGCTYGWGAISAVSVVRVHAEAATLSESVADDPILAAVSVSSSIDGLGEWIGISAARVEVDFPTNDREHLRSRIEVGELSEVGWRSGTFTLTAATSWSQSEERRSIIIADNVVLVSEAHEERPLEEHFAAQQPIRDLITLVYGVASRIRAHSLTHPMFPVPSDFESDQRRLAVPFVHRRTIADTSRPEWTSRQCEGVGTLTPFTAVEVAGLEQWELHHPRLRRAIDPIVGLIGREPVIEDLLINSCMAIEALGKALPPVGRESATYNGRVPSPTFSTYVLRCFERAGVPHHTFDGTLAAIARTVSRRYADVKHPNENRFPDPFETLVLGNLSLLAMRIALMTFAITDENATDQRSIDRQFDELRRWGNEGGIVFSELWGAQ